MKTRHSTGSYKNFTLRELEERGIELSTEATDIIYKNPIIADLPSAAEWCGLYSAFFVGNNNIYFVYGLDQKVIHKAKFIEAGSSIYPQDYVSRFGYYPASGFIRTTWNVDIVTGRIEDVLRINRKMKVIEMITSRYKASGYEFLPEAFAWAEDNNNAVHYDFIDVLENRIVKDGPDKDKWIAYEHMMLGEIAAWQFPVFPDNFRKCGMLAFQQSRYCPLKADNAARIEEIYKDTSKWLDGFKENVDECYALTMSKAECDYVKSRLSQMNIPYQENNDKHKLMERTIRNNHLQLNKTLSDAIGKERTVSEHGYVSVYKKDIAVVEYICSEYVKSRFSQDNLSWGDELYNRSLQERRLCTPDAGFASFIFFVPAQILDSFKEFAKNNDIFWGHPTDPTLNMYPYDLGVFLIVEAFDMPLVEHFLLSVYDNIMCSHDVSVNHDAPGECRFPSKPAADGSVAAYSFSSPWHYSRDKLTVSALDGKTVSVPMNVLDGSWWCIPGSEYESSGMHVDNSGALKASFFRPSVTEAAELIRKGNYSAI